MEKNDNIDSFEEELNNKKLLLENCQNEKYLESCLNCTKVLDCEIRDNYVKAVYNSMNKGESGGFEF